MKKNGAGCDLPPFVTSIFLYTDTLTAENTPASPSISIKPTTGV